MQTPRQTHGRQGSFCSVKPISLGRGLERQCTIDLRQVFACPLLAHNGTFFDTAPYGFGETRDFTLTLLIFNTSPGWCSCGVVIAKFSGYAVTFRSLPTVLADIPISRSTSTRILSGKPPRAMWSAAVLFGLYRITSSLTGTDC